MTDVVVSGPRGLRSFKVETTPHDFTVCFREGLAFAAESLGYESATAFLAKVAQIRWSSTITTNVLAELKGSRVGVLVTSGFEDSLYGPDTPPAISRIVPRENIIGMRPDASPEELVRAVRTLLENGARRICVSYRMQYPDNAAERRAKAMIHTQYPDHFLGAVPILLGSEMAQTVDDATRLNCSVINAYVHSELAASLFTAEDTLRAEFEWIGSLLIGHTNGGVARLGKTKAVDTIESGPIFGTFGAAHFARHYKREGVIALDVGGTTTKASAIRDGRPVYLASGDFLGIPVRGRMPLLQSLAMGGGSVVRRRGTDGVELGPESTGSAPGPACYGLGGENATLTDALLCLGYLDPAAFLGGRRNLDRDRARKALAQAFEASEDSIETIAEGIRDEAVVRMSGLVSKVASVAGFTPKDLALFAFGGNGPMLGALVCQQLGIGECWVFGLAPVFGAFGSAISRVVHVYERGLVGAVTTQHCESEATVLAIEMMARAAAELQAEGLEPNKALFEVECRCVDSDHNEYSISIGAIDRESDAQAIERHIALALRQRFTNKSKRDRIVTVIVSASYPVLAYEPKPDSKRAKTKKTLPSRVSRKLYFVGAWRAASLFDWSELAIGQTVGGPAIVASDTLTCLVPPDWTLELDEYGNGRLWRT